MWARLTVAVWYFFNDVYPPLHNGHTPLDPPAWWIHLFDRRPAPVEETPETEEFVDPGLGRNAAPEVAAL
jgi:Derlin-2/3